MEFCDVFKNSSFCFLIMISNSFKRSLSSFISSLLNLSLLECLSCFVILQYSGICNFNLISNSSLSKQCEEIRLAAIYRESSMLRIYCHCAIYSSDVRFLLSIYNSIFRVIVGIIANSCISSSTDAKIKKCCIFNNVL